MVTYRGASEYELGSMGSNSSSFRLAAVEVHSRVGSSTGTQGVPCHRALPSPEVEPVVARPKDLALTHKLESRVLGEISITSDMQKTPPLWQKEKN